MTEQQWLDCSNPRPMLEFLHDKSSERKLRLFSASIGRQVYQVLGDGAKKAVELIEHYAEVPVSRAVFSPAYEEFLRHLAYPSIRGKGQASFVVAVMYYMLECQRVDPRSWTLDLSWWTRR